MTMGITSVVIPRRVMVQGSARLLTARRGEISGVTLTRPLFRFRGLLVKLNGGTEHLRGTVWIGRIAGPFAPGAGKARS